MRSLAMLLGGTLMLMSLRGLGAPCLKHGAEVQVLGSGGPELSDKRASSSYLVWLEGRPVALIDAGGGSALKFGQSGAHLEQLDAIFFSHLHIDHTADFPALVKSSYFESRDRPLPVYGPGGNEDFPPTTEFVKDLFGERVGAYRYLSNFLKGGEGGYELKAYDVVPAAHAVLSLPPTSRLTASAASVVHGHVPALAWRLQAGNRSFVFSGDTDGANGNLQVLAKGADVLVAHNAVPEGTTGGLLALHMPPSVIGRIAQSAGVKRLVLSHRMLRTLGEEKSTLAAINSAYQGEVRFADDGDCF